jgi:hypothetical protein
MKRLAVVVVLAFLAAPVALVRSAVQDFTGKWSGAFITTGPDGTTRNEKIFMELKHKGTELTGTAGPSEERQWPLQGKVDGTKLTFDVQADGPTLKFLLNYAEGHLKGDAAGEFEGNKLSAKIDAERTKK